MSKKENKANLEKLQKMLLANTPHILEFAQRSDLDDSCGNITVVVKDGRGMFKVVGDQETIANSFHIECTWSEKGAYKLKIKPLHELRRKAKEIAKHAAEYTWGRHDPTYGFPQDQKAYDKARKELVQFILRSVVTDRVQQFFEESSRGI